MEDIILKILKDDFNPIQLIGVLIILLIFLIKNRKTQEKIDLIGDNHLHAINETLQRIENKIETGFNRLENKLSDVQKSVEIIKDRQSRK